MRDQLHTILSTFQASRDSQADHHPFALFYDALQQLVSEGEDARWLEDLTQVLAWYESVARAEYSDILWAPNSAINHLAFDLAGVLAQTTGQAPYAILYRQALTSAPYEGQQACWSNVFSDSHANQLSDKPGDFAVVHTGAICLLPELIDAALGRFQQGDRNWSDIWLDNDSRSQKPLPEAFLQALGVRFPAFKRLHDHLAAVVWTGSPLGKLQDLRQGLAKGSTKGSGTEYNAGPEANEALTHFAEWWEEIRHVPYQNGQSLRAVLGELTTGCRDFPTLEELLAVIIREQTVDLSTATTCVQLRGNDLDSTIQLNHDFLQSLEQHDLTPQRLTTYQQDIEQAFQASLIPASPVFPKGLYPVFVPSTVLDYRSYAFSQLWGHFCQGKISPRTLQELQRVLEQLTDAHRQALWHHPVDCAEFPPDHAVRLYLRDLEKKLAANLLLSAVDCYPLSATDQALLAIVASNAVLLAWAASRYEGILFSQAHWLKLAGQHKLILTLGAEHLCLQDRYDLVGYIDRKTTGRENAHPLQNALRKKWHLPSKPLPLSLYIKWGWRSRYNRLLDQYSAAATHVDWHSGESMLMLASLYGRPHLCQRLLEAGANPRLKNAHGKTPVECWGKATWFVGPSSNPFVAFHQELLALAEVTEHWTARQLHVFNVVVQHPHLLMWQLAGKTSLSFLQKVVTLPNRSMLDRLQALETWPVLSWQSQDNGFNALHFIAYQGRVELYPYVTAIDVNSPAICQRTALHFAAMKNHSDFCALLIRHNAYLDSQDKEGHTPLMTAACKGYGDLCVLLLKAGANSQLNNQQGKTAQRLWAESGSTDPDPWQQYHEQQWRDKKSQWLKVLKPKPVQRSGVFSEAARVAYNRALTQLHQRIEVASWDENQNAQDILDGIVADWQNQFGLSLADSTQNALSQSVDESAHRLLSQDAQERVGAILSC